ncbi:hypothetical protein LU293_07365 [Moraxella nasovis]|uniref:helix-turn-helix domain-containing protein n=1 Tax=Moraxella nasovis TaxID=2904121 RepID=UPI001F611C9B|nr:helix-turn-helix domain-containing protein [Moraxella nasovis]UNU72906.1 hypothetical protein LU293_07365 [Moraxella nasovis]
MIPITHAHKNRQKWQVLQAMLDGDGVHVLYAVNVLNVVSLSSRIAELKKLGFIIDWQWHETENSRFKRYFIKDKVKAMALREEILNKPKTKTTKKGK